ncbi:MAG: rhomboid family intramembrane serine protease [Breznakibacter sp.]
MSILNEIKHSYRNGSVLTKLIYINLTVFLLIRLLPFVLWLFRVVEDPQQGTVLLRYVSVPSSPAELLVKPWTLFTYMFVHYDFLHVLFNMLCLFWFGRLFLDFMRPSQLLGVYIYGGLGGAIVYLLSFNLVPVFISFAPSSILLGASASALAILFAVAAHSPNHRIYLIFIGPARLKYIALVYLLVDLVGMTTLENTGGHLAHLGGALVGYLYVASLRKGSDWARIFESFRGGKFNFFKKRAKMTVTHKRPLTDMEYNAHKMRRQQEIDRILEKIKRSGYDSLTSEEKKVLFEASQE